MKVPPPPPPPPLKIPSLDVSLNCGYQRLRKALLWNDSKLLAAFCELLVSFDILSERWSLMTEGPEFRDCSRFIDLEFRRRI